MGLYLTFPNPKYSYARAHECPHTHAHVHIVGPASLPDSLSFPVLTLE